MRGKMVPNYASLAQGCVVVRGDGPWKPYGFDWQIDRASQQWKTTWKKTYVYTFLICNIVYIYINTWFLYLLFDLLIYYYYPRTFKLSKKNNVSVPAAFVPRPSVDHPRQPITRHNMVTGRMRLHTTHIWLVVQLFHLEKSMEFVNGVGMTSIHVKWKIYQPCLKPPTRHIFTWVPTCISPPARWGSLDLNLLTLLCQLRMQRSTPGPDLDITSSGCRGTLSFNGPDAVGYT